MNTQINNQLDILGANALTIIPTTGESEVPVMSGSQALATPVSLSWRDLKLIEKITEIDKVSPIKADYCSYTLTGDTRVAQLMGVGIEIFDINSNFELSSGRTFLRSDKAAAIIGAKIAHPDSEDNPILHVGDRLKITTLAGSESKEMTLRIIGITKGKWPDHGS